MDDKAAASFEAANEAEMSCALELLYEMALGYVLGELRDQHPTNYEKLTNQPRSKSQLINNVRYSVDTMLEEIIGEHSDDPLEDCEGK